MEQEEYIKSRVDSDYSFYNTRAKQYRTVHLTFRILVVLISASITVIANVEFDIKNVLMSILSSSIIILVGIYELMKFREQVDGI